MTKKLTIGDRMTVAEFVADCVDGYLTDYDGHGELATEHEVSDCIVHASDAAKPGWCPQPWATHVVWYNK